MITFRIPQAAGVLALSVWLVVAHSVLAFAQQIPLQERARPETQDNVPSTQSELEASNGPECASPVPEEPRAELFVPAEKPVSNPKGQRQKRERVANGSLVLTDDPTPTLPPDTAFCTKQAAERYRHITDEGGWPAIPRTLGRDAAPGDVKRLRQRLSIEGDLPHGSLSGDRGDDALTDALKSFQRRAGL